MKRILLSVTCLFLLLTACDKSDDKQIEPAPVVTLKGCRLTKMEVPGTASMLFTYNSAGNLEKSEAKFQGSTNTQAQTYLYNAQNQMISKTLTQNGVVQYQKSFEYKNGLISKTITTEGSNVREEEYIYDGNRILTEVKLINAGYPFKSLYTYDVKGNVTKITSFTGTDVSYESTFSNYDDKPNFYGTIAGLNIPDSDDLMDLGGIMKNNPGRVRYVAFSQQAGGTVQQIVDMDNTYTYVYGPDGLPTRVTTKDKTGNVQAIDLSYNCN